ncbi:MAG TPA: S8 family serine peptidase, partial [Acidimicrobiales bacterium]|nr:S8 family serine peptidase [Acidimicrobiales bacterium]
MRAVLLAVAVALAAALGSPPADAAERADLVVKLEDGGDAEAAARALGGRLGLVVAADTVVVKDGLLGGGRPAGTEWVAPDTTYEATREPTDACYRACPFSLDGQPELVAVGAPAAWDVTTGSPDVVVAVLDGVVDTRHADLVGKVRAGPTYVTGGCQTATSSQASHATGVAGVVGAITDNGLGIASLGWRTSVLSIAVLDPCGIGTASEVSAGIRHAADTGARVINLSLAGTAHPALAEAVAYAQGRGSLVVAAAGNGRSTEPVFPAGYPGVLAVGATARDGSRPSEFSNRGAWVDLVAPGERIVSTATVAGGYLTFDGTSFAAPLVSAAAALVVASHPTFTAADVATRLARTARPLAGTNGLLDAAAAVTDLPGGFVMVAADGGAF